MSPARRGCCVERAKPYRRSASARSANTFCAQGLRPRRFHALAMRFADCCSRMFASFEERPAGISAGASSSGGDLAHVTFGSAPPPAERFPAEGSPAEGSPAERASLLAERAVELASPPPSAVSSAPLGMASRGRLLSRGDRSTETSVARFGDTLGDALREDGLDVGASAGGSDAAAEVAGGGGARGGGSGGARGWGGGS